MRKRLFKKYLSLFRLTLKNGCVVPTKPVRRWPSHYYLPQNHPLTARRTNRHDRERARVLPALLKAPIREDIKTSFVRLVGWQCPMKPVRPEHEGRPRKRLLSAVSFYKGRVSMKGKTDRQYLAALDAEYSKLLRERPQLLGKRLQSGHRVKR
jgi:hypothetical protein